MLQDLAHTLRARLVEHPRFAAPKRPPSTFAVDHYAGLVAYACDAMMDKNKDFVVAEHQSLMANSRFPFVQCAPHLLRSCWARWLKQEPLAVDSAVLMLPGCAHHTALLRQKSH